MAVSVILIVHNEAGKVRRCLDAVRWADEIVIVDQSSTDETASICRQYTDKVFTVPSKGYCDPDRKFAVSKTSNDWVLYVDADEVVTDKLKEEISALMVSEPPFGSYFVLRKNFLLGKWIRGSGWHPNYIIRLFKKDRVVFSDKIHVDISPVGRSGYLKGEILHYSYDTIDDYIEKLDRYTTILAQEGFARGKRIKPFTIGADFIITPLAYYFSKLILKGGFRDGLRGLLIATFTFFTIFITNAKIYQMQKGCK